MSCIQDLPNELIYRIFDNIDACSIIQFCYTCKRFYSCVNNYNSYKINLESILKVNFDLICRLINPLNIKSLILSDDDKTPGQIKLFIKTFPISQLKAVKSLKLIKLNENDLETILKTFINNPLNSLDIEYRQYFTMLNQSTISLLQKMLSFESLNKVNLDMRSYQVEYVQWPQITHIKYLTLLNSNFYQFLQIIQDSNHYQSINLKNFTMQDFDETKFKKIYLNNLKSFTIEDSELFITKIQILLLFMNNITYFKLEGHTNMIENIFQDNQLEEFFQTNLIYLKNFQFFIRFSPRPYIKDNLIIESFIEQFQRSYWISNLNCFINCDFIRNSNEIHIYSIPCIYHCFKYSDKLDMISLSTLSSFNYLNERFHFIHQLELNVKDLDIKNLTEDHRLFPRLNYLKLTINDQCPINCFELLSKLIFLNNLEKIVLIISSRGDYLSIIIRKFLMFLKDLSNINSIEIFNRWHGIFTSVDIHYFCSVIPMNVKHIDIDIADINHIKTFISRLEHVSSFKFKFAFDKSRYVKDILEWLSSNGINVAHVSDIHYLSLWISKQSKPTNNNKRIKLSD